MSIAQKAPVGNGYFELTLRGVESCIDAAIVEIHQIMSNLTIIGCAKSLHASLIGSKGCNVKELTADTTCRLTFADEGKAIISGTAPHERRLVQRRLEDKVSWTALKVRVLPLAGAPGVEG